MCKLTRDPLFLDGTYEAYLDAYFFLEYTLPYLNQSNIWNSAFSFYVFYILNQILTEPCFVKDEFELNDSVDDLLESSPEKSVDTKKIVTDMFDIDQVELHYHHRRTEGGGGPSLPPPFGTFC